MSAAYFYHDGTGANGPFSLLEMLALKDRFVIRADTKVRKGEGEWKSAAEFHEFSAALAPAAATLRSPKSNGIAALLTIALPGAGQLYQDRIGLGIVIFFVTALGYLCLIIPGLIIHVCAIVDAATWDGTSDLTSPPGSPNESKYLETLPDGRLVPKKRTP